MEDVDASESTAQPWAGRQQGNIALIPRATRNNSANINELGNKFQILDENHNMAKIWLDHNLVGTSAEIPVRLANS